MMKQLTAFLLSAFYICSSVSCQNVSSVSGEQSSPPTPVNFRKLSSQEKQYYQQQLQNYCAKAYPDHLFSGGILVAKNGDIVYEQYSGWKNQQTKELNAENTPFHLASISKTFTGTAVLKLHEQGLLNIDDGIEKYFPNFPYTGITIRLLLSHRSGLPSYLNFLDKNWNRKKKATNQDVVNYMYTYKPPKQANPNRNFHYCNTNYVLLALIIEKVTQQSFPQFMKDSVFTPLGMTNTFVFSKVDSAQYVPTYSFDNRIYPMDHLDFTYGDKNIYSTPRDLLLWDLAMYQNSYVSAATYELATTPQSHERKSMHNYGLGWRLFEGPTPQETFVYHNGKWHGSNTVFTRFVNDTTTIIVLGNKLNRNIYGARKMISIFNGSQKEFEVVE